MHPGPARKSLPLVGSAGLFLFLRREQVRGERAEVTVTEGRKKGPCTRWTSLRLVARRGLVLPLRAPPVLPGTPSVCSYADWALSPPGFPSLRFGSP